MRKHRSVRSGILACAVLALGGCSLDLQDPNRPTEDEVFGNLDGIKAVAIGLQAEYGNEVIDPIYVQALITDELGAGPNSFQTFKDVDLGTRLEWSSWRTTSSGRPRRRTMERRRRAAW